MPTIFTGASQCNERMWQALKTHIMRERQKKKQEQKADEEEERLRKEKEYQQKQDVMTLGETREQISNLEEEIVQLTKEKQNLYIVLQKSFFEEYDRKKQEEAKEKSIHSELLTEENPPLNIKVPPQRFLPVKRNTSPLYESNAVEQQYVSKMRPCQRTFNPPPMRNMLHPYVSYYKSPCISNCNLLPHKTEEVDRRPNDSRAVLWNRKNQYFYYSTAPNQNVYNYSVTSQSARQVPEPINTIYPPESRMSLPAPAYVTNVHQMEYKRAYDEEKHYLRPNLMTMPNYPVDVPPPPPPASYTDVPNVGTPSRPMYTHNIRYL